MVKALSTPQELMNESLDYAPALLSHYPELIGRLPWLSLRKVVSPVVPRRLMRTQHLFGANYVFIKKEIYDADFISENQARKLEFSLAPYFTEEEKPKISVFDYIGSEHAYAVAQLMKMIGQTAEINFIKAPADDVALLQLNELQKMGVKINFLQSMKAYEFQTKWKGYLAGFTKAKLLPMEGFCPQACLGYISSMFEVKEQVQSAQLCPLDYVFVPVFTGASLVGMEIGKRLAGLDDLKIVGVQCDEFASFNKQRLAETANQAIEILNQHLNKKIQFKLTAQDFDVVEDYRAGKSAHDAGEMARWCARIRELEDVELDVHGSARAFLGMSELIKKRGLESKRILFWNTFSSFRADRFKQDIRHLKLPSAVKGWKMAS